MLTIKMLMGPITRNLKSRDKGAHASVNVVAVMVNKGSKWPHSEIERCLLLRMAVRRG